MKTLTRTELDGLTCMATFSDCDQYRYDLVWRWSPAPILTMCALNPSTATHEKLDPTVKGMIKRARAWGLGGFQMLNLFALRATDPEVMKAHASPVGDDNDAVLRATFADMAAEGQFLLAGWGTHGRHRQRDAAVMALAASAGVEIAALATNGDGSPKHPLYVAHAIQPKPWVPPA